MNTQFIRLGRIFPAVILVLVVGAVCLSYYKRSLSVRSSGNGGQKMLAENLAAVTEGFSFLQSEEGRTKFEIRARSNLGFKDNKNLLEAVTVKVFAKDGKRYDTISSEHCEYDQQKEEIVFLGNVVITLGHSGSAHTETEQVPSDKATTIQVERITYLKSSHTAQTDGLVRFSRGNIRGTCLGLTYDSERESIRLHAAVEILVQPTEPRQAPVELRCGTMIYYKSGEQIDMQANVALRQGDNSMNANSMKAWLRPGDFSISRLDAVGEVRSVSLDPRVLLQVDAAELAYLFDGSGRWLERVVAKQNVNARSLDSTVKRDLSADELEIVLKPESNLVRSLFAKNNVVLLFADRNKTVAKNFSDFRSDPRFDRSCEPGDKRVKAPIIQAVFHHDGRHLARVDTSGPSLLEEFPLSRERDKTVLSASSFHLFFDGESSHVERFQAEQAVRVEVLSLAAEAKTSTSDHLEAFFDPLTRQLAQLHQFGNFHYQEGSQWATAADATYFAETRRTVLKGEPLVKDATSRTSADVIELDRQENRFKAQGRVRSVFESAGKQAQTVMFQAHKPVYASAALLEVDIHKGIATYNQQAKMWQEDQVLRAETIVLYRDEKRLAAEKNVSSLFYLEESGGRQSERKPVRVNSNRLLYDDQVNKAAYYEDVHMDSSLGKLSSNQLEVFLKSKGNRKSVDRMLATGKVKITQPGKVATSELAEFFHSEKRAVLTGGMPRVLDPERGSTTGACLTLSFDDGSITVVGNPETRSITKQRVAR